MNKKVYQTYKQDIYSSASDSIRTDGYYLQIGDLNPRVSYRYAIIFYCKGYTTRLRLEENTLQNQIKTKITNNFETSFIELDWWKINNDSLVIEHYGENKRDMVTWNFYERGKILNDSLIELKYDDSHYPPIKFKFVRTDSLPKIENNGRYLKKAWYIEQLNKKRKNYR